MNVRLSKTYTFPAAHRLHSPALSDEQNRAAYGKCNNPYGHGHDYEVEVTVVGPVNAATGRVMGLAELDEIAERAFLRPFRYRNLNAEMNSIPTTENLASDILMRLRNEWPADGARLEIIRIRETERNICEIWNER